MQLNVTVNKVTITESSIFNSGEYGVNSIRFTFSEEYEGLSKRAIFTTPENKSFLVSIVDDECVIPEEALKLQGNVFIGVYAYQNEDDNLILRYSPSPVKFFIDNGSYVETKKTAVPPEALQDIYIKIEKFINDVQQQIDDGDFDGVGISNIVFDSNYVMTITMTDGTIYTSPSLKGDTPQKGVDYWTEEDKQEIITEVEGHIPTKVSELENDSQFIDNTVDDLVNYSTTSAMNTAIGNAVGTETTARQNADVNLQQQIDAITSASDVVDVVSTYTDLENYSTSGLTANDVVKVLQDSTHNNALSYYRWKLVNTIGEWQYIGSEGPSYTKSESDALYNNKQDKITSTNKLASDLVDDSTSTNKFVTASDKTNWNAKVSDTDYATDIKGGVVKANVNGFVLGNTGNPYANTYTYAQYRDTLNNNYFIGKGTLENVITGKQLVNETQLNSKADKSALVTGEGENITLQNTAELDFIQPPLPRGNSEQVQYSGKNKFTAGTGQTTNTGVTANYNESEIKLNGTTTRGGNIFLDNTLGTLNSYRKIGTFPAGTYFLSFTKLSGSLDFTDGGQSAFYIRKGNDINNQLCTIDIAAGTITQTRTFTLTEEATLYCQYYVNKASVVYNNYLFRIQIEEGSTATDYEPYVGGTASPNPSYPQAITNVTGDTEVLIQNKNLLQITEENVLVHCSYVSGANTEQFKLLCTASDMYINEVSSTGTSYNKSRNGNLITCKYGETIYFDIGNLLFTKNYFTEFDENLVSLGYYDKIISNGTYTPRNSNCKYITLRIGYGVNAVAGTTYTLAPIICKISDTTYTPHKEQTLPLTLGNIELCKIGNYQDYFYKESNKWYLHKEIGKEVLDGSENWGKGSNTHQFYITKPNNMIMQSQLICDYFTNQETSSQNGIWVGNSLLNINHLDYSVLADFKTWLSTHNTIVYYVLATATDTEITDTTLINQLEAILQAISYEEQTNISGSSDESNPLFEVQAVEYKEPDYWTIAYVNTQIGNAIGGAY